MQSRWYETKTLTFPSDIFFYLLILLFISEVLYLFLVINQRIFLPFPYTNRANSLFQTLISFGY